MHKDRVVCNLTKGIIYSEKLMPYIIYLITKLLKHFYITREIKIILKWSDIDYEEANNFECMQSGCYAGIYWVVGMQHP